MFCSKCGKEIMNEAVICPNCGCATNNYQVANTVNVCSDDYPKIKDFREKADKVRMLGIFAAVFMFGIGLIFSIIIWVTMSKVTIPEITTTNPKEIVEFESAKRKYTLGQSLAALPLFGLALSVFIGMIIAYIG